MSQIVDIVSQSDVEKKNSEELNRIIIEKHLDDIIDLNAISQEDNVNHYILQRNRNQQTIYQLMDKIEYLKKTNKELEKNIWKKCQHEWEYDTASCFDDRTKYFCSKCKLWRNSYWYQ